jgi:hypothetical protein
VLRKRWAGQYWLVQDTQRKNTEGTAMKKIKDEVATLERGRRVTVELEHNEYLLSFKDGAYYRLGGQAEDIVQGNIIIASPIEWCSASQKWEDA